MTKLDPTKMKDWEVAEAAEEQMKSVYELSEELGLEKMELLPYAQGQARREIHRGDRHHPDPTG